MISRIKKIFNIFQSKSNWREEKIKEKTEKMKEELSQVKEWFRNINRESVSEEEIAIYSQKLSKLETEWQEFCFLYRPDLLD